MISAFEIYLVMQLDSILTGLILITLASSVSAGAFALAGFGGFHGKDERCILAAKRLLATATIALGLSVVIPSTKTAAAMIVIPAIVNNEKVQAEAGDLYELAKAAMRDAVTDEKPE